MGLLNVHHMWVIIDVSFLVKQQFLEQNDCLQDKSCGKGWEYGMNSVSHHSAQRFFADYNLAQAPFEEPNLLRTDQNLSLHAT